MTGEMLRIYEVADDYEKDIIDALRDKAGITWTHRADDHTWTNMVGEPCEKCGKEAEPCRNSA